MIGIRSQKVMWTLNYRVRVRHGTEIGFPAAPFRHPFITCIATILAVHMLYILPLIYINNKPNYSERAIGASGKDAQWTDIPTPGVELERFSRRRGPRVSNRNSGEVTPFYRQLRLHHYTTTTLHRSLSPRVNPIE